MPANIIDVITVINLYRAQVVKILTTSVAAGPVADEFAVIKYGIAVVLVALPAAVKAGPPLPGAGFR